MKESDKKEIDELKKWSDSLRAKYDRMVRRAVSDAGGNLELSQKGRGR